MSAAFLSHAVKVRGNSRDRYMEPKKVNDLTKNSLGRTKTSNCVYLRNAIYLAVNLFLRRKT